MKLNNINNLINNIKKNNDFDFYLYDNMSNGGYIILQIMSEYDNTRYKDIKLTEKEVIYLCKINNYFKQFFLEHFKLIVTEYRIKDDSIYSLFKDCCILSIYNKAINKIDLENEKDKKYFGLHLLRRYSRINRFLRITKEINKDNASCIMDLFNQSI